MVDGHYKETAKKPPWKVRKLLTELQVIVIHSDGAHNHHAITMLQSWTSS